MLTIILIVLIFIIILNAKFGSSLRNFFDKVKIRRSIPGPKVYELLENVKKDRVLTWLKECTINYGPIFKIWLGKDLTIFVTDPDYIKTILSSNNILHKSVNYNFLKPWLQKGLLTNGGEDWHRKRKLLTPAFHFKILGTFKEPIEDNCDILINKLKHLADGEQIVNIYSYITLFALDVICETAMGIKKHAQSEAESEYVQATKNICKLLHKHMFSTWQRFPFLYKFTAASKRKQRTLEILHGETKRVINLRRSMLDKMNLNTIDDIDKEDDIGAKRRFAFLDILLLTQKEIGQLTDENIQEEVDTFMFEGHDTISSAISFLIYLLAQHPHVQKKAYDEAMMFAGKETEPMSYLDAVIKEGMRLFPPVPLFGRMTTEPFQIGSLTIPKNTSITILCYMVHRNPNIFPDPEAFIPERYLNGTQFHPFSNIAFSAGHRNCIGQRFALLEMKCSIMKLLRAYKFLPVEGFTPNLKPELILKSENGVQVRMKIRQ